MGQFEVPTDRTREVTWEMVKWLIWSSFEAQCHLGGAVATGPDESHMRVHGERSGGEGAFILQVREHCLQSPLP